MQFNRKYTYILSSFRISIFDVVYLINQTNPRRKRTYISTLQPVLYSMTLSCLKVAIWKDHLEFLKLLCIPTKKYLKMLQRVRCFHALCGVSSFSISWLSMFSWITPLSSGSILFITSSWVPSGNSTCNVLIQPN